MHSTAHFCLAPAVSLTASVPVALRRWSNPDCMIVTNNGDTFITDPKDMGTAFYANCSIENGAKCRVRQTLELGMLRS